MVVASIGYIAFTLYGAIGEIAILDNITHILMLIATFSLVSIIAIAAIGYAWKLNLEFLSNENLNTNEIFAIFLRAGLSKYLPGNVMQYVTRNLYAQKIGITQTKMAFGSVLEVGLVAIISFVLALVLGREVLFGLLFEYVQVWTYIAGISGLLVIVCIAAFLLRKTKIALYVKENIIKQFSEIKPSKFIAFFLKMTALVTYSHIALGVMFFFMLRAVTGLSDISLLVVLPAYIIAWFIGFVTPGSPAGIGVKETILSLLLAGAYAREYVLVAALLLRVATVLADILAFALYYLYQTIVKVRG